MVSKHRLRAAGFAALAAAGVVHAVPARRNQRVVALDDYRSNARRAPERSPSGDGHDWPSVVNALLTRTEF